ncbi:MAG: hypothetical protein AB1805_12875 [Nitrospirota bacterium]
MKQPKAVDTDGVLAAALLASGIGSAALGISSIVVAAVAPLKQMMTLYDRTSLLGGKALLSLALWAISWAVLHFRWQYKQKDFWKIFRVTIVLDLLGLAASLQPISDAFAK